MKISALRRFREKLAADRPVFGLWVTLESASITEMAVALGMDWIVIDAEHGHLDWGDILEHIRAAVRSETVVLVRVAESNAGLIKRALDIGADGIVVPWIETADQLQSTVAHALYPLQGKRGIGAERATCWGQSLAQHTLEANDNVLIIPVIETVTAGRNIPELCQVPGVEIFFLGPADYSSTAGHRGQWEGPGVAADLQTIKNTVRTQRKACGIIATSNEELIDRRHQGFRMLGIGSDSGLLLRALHGALGLVGQDRRIDTSLIPMSSPLPTTPLPQPPKSFRPDRLEAVAQPGMNPAVELAPGMTVDILVGAFNQARNLTTGAATLKPGARLPYHTHPVSESITVLSGCAIVGVEGREYRLTALDNIVIPRAVAHSVWNDSEAEDAGLHVALASSSPARDFVATPFERRAMADEAMGVTGKERVTRFRSAKRFEAGPGTSFIDYFNRELMPGIEMSGGYGLFQPNGRLPAHFHDFDESICIIQGAATCVVEGRRHKMSNGATALQPRGRVHYFVNEATEPMAMIWVYAGPEPERVIVDESCATAEGNPWKVTAQ